MLKIEISPAAAGSRASNLKTTIYNPNRGNLLPLRVYKSRYTNKYRTRAGKGTEGQYAVLLYTFVCGLCIVCLALKGAL